MTKLMTEYADLNHRSPVACERGHDDVIVYLNEATSIPRVVSGKGRTSPSGYGISMRPDIVVGVTAAFSATLRMDKCDEINETIIIAGVRNIVGAIVIE